MPAMIDPDGSEHDIPQAGVVALSRLGWKLKQRKPEPSPAPKRPVEKRR